jgi:hypothetical protein
MKNTSLNISDFTMCEMLQSKFLHDMASPVSAVRNGVEFLNETRNEVQKKAIELMKMSSKEAALRIGFLRPAFGYMFVNGEANLLKYISQAEEFFEKNRIKIVNNSKLLNVKVTNKVVKLIYNMFYIASTVMIYGGNIELNYSMEDGKINIHIITQSNAGIKKDNDIIALLIEKNNDVGINSKNIHLQYFKRLCETNEINYQCEMGEDLYISAQLEVEIEKLSDDTRFKEFAT